MLNFEYIIVQNFQGIFKKYYFSLYEIRASTFILFDRTIVYRSFERIADVLEESRARGRNGGNVFVSSKDFVIMKANRRMGKSPSKNNHLVENRSILCKAVCKRIYRRLINKVHRLLHIDAKIFI